MSLLQCRPQTLGIYDHTALQTAVVVAAREVQQYGIRGTILELAEIG